MGTGGRVLFAAGVVLACVAPTPASPGLPQTLPAEMLPNYKLLRPSVAVGGQPTAEALRQLKDAGLRGVVNLRTESEGAAQSEALVKELGLGYTWIPVTPASLSRADAKRLSEVLSDPKQTPTLVFCASGNRVGALFALLEASSGRDIEEAIALGREAGMRSPVLVDAVRRAAAAP